MGKLGNRETGKLGNQHAKDQSTNPLTLPANFQFSQRTLQDYVDCPRRFQLRYLLRLAWPALEAEPALENERYLQQGAAFHRLVHQHVLGIPPERLSSTVTDEDLSRWWHSYLESGLAGLPATRYPEVVLSGALGHDRETGPSTGRLVARYDLVAVGPSAMLRAGPSAMLRAGPSAMLRAGAGRRAVIVDWKTSRKRTQRKWLAGRLQTRVYSYLLVRAGSHLNAGQPFEPGQVEMVYWFANFPADPERFSYDAAQFRADEVYLTSLIEEIKGLALSSPKGLRDDDFPLTTQKRRCRYCPYRSLCRRGVRAGAFDEVEDEPDSGYDFDISLDFEQIAEIEY